MNLSAWAIRNPVPPIALFLVLSIVGLFSFLELPVTRFPNVDVPVVSVTVVQPGAAPRELVSGVTQPLEDALAEINGVHRITSSISMSSSVTTIEFEMEVLPDRAVSDVTGAVTQLRGTLPQDIVEPVVSRVDFTDLPILTYAIADPAQSTTLSCAGCNRNSRSVMSAGRAARTG
jgi:multidrug efflux pump subunit AcrB